MMNEQEGCALLKRRFEAAGFTIVENYPLVDGELRLTLDGFDPARRVGYEYITTAAGDRHEITPRALALVEERIAAGGLYLLLLDEEDVSGADELDRLAGRFLDSLAGHGLS